MLAGEDYVQDKPFQPFILIGHFAKLLSSFQLDFLAKTQSIKIHDIIINRFLQCIMGQFSLQLYYQVGGVISGKTKNTAM